MGILGKALRGLGVLAVAAFTLAGYQAPAASAATGTVLADRERVALIFVKP